MKKEAFDKYAMIEYVTDIIFRENTLNVYLTTTNLP